MPKLGQSSKEKLATTHPQLQKVLNKVINYFDFTVLEGRRSEERQDRLYEQGRSTVPYPNSKHNKQPSQAVDIAPYPIDWDDRERFYFLAGFVIATAESMGISLRWGGDWDMDRDFDDQTFDDLVHFELF